MSSQHPCEVGGTSSVLLMGGLSTERFGGAVAMRNSGGLQFWLYTNSHLHIHFTPLKSLEMVLGLWCDGGGEVEVPSWGSLGPLHSTVALWGPAGQRHVRSSTSGTISVLS